jgi:hypothetical protein
MATKSSMPYFFKHWSSQPSTFWCQSREFWGLSCAGSVRR